MTSFHPKLGFLLAILLVVASLSARPVDGATQPHHQAIRVEPVADVPWKVEVVQLDKAWYQDPLFVSIAGWLVALLGISIQISAQRRQINLQLAEERRQINDERREQEKGRREQLAVENARARADKICEKLNEFFLPYKQLSDTNRLLRQIVGKGKPDDFRVLLALLNGDSLSDNDRALIEEIVSIGKRLEGLLADRSGYDDDRELRPLFALAAEHFRVLRLAYERKLGGEPESFRGKVYPRELDGRLESRIDSLEAELADLNSLLDSKAVASREPIATKSA